MQTTLSWRWGVAGLIAACIAMSPMAFPEHGSGKDARQMANLAFTVKDMDGHDVRLASFRGRPLVINFWATWCGPCRLEIPHLVELAEKYKAQGLIVLGVSIDDDPAD